MERRRNESSEAGGERERSPENRASLGSPAINYGVIWDSACAAIRYNVPRWPVRCFSRAATAGERRSRESSLFGAGCFRRPRQSWELKREALHTRTQAEVRGPGGGGLLGMGRDWG